MFLCEAGSTELKAVRGVLKYEEICNAGQYSVNQGIARNEAREDTRSQVTSS